LQRESGEPIFDRAGLGRRFGNVMIDTFVFSLLVFLAATLNNKMRADLPAPAVSLSVYLVYYTVGDGLFGATIGKLLTRTRVISDTTGRPPGLARGLLRTVIRLLPFEWFMFWHDSWTTTSVVPSRSVARAAAGAVRD